MRLSVAARARSSYTALAEQLDTGKKIDFNAALAMLFKVSAPLPSACVEVNRPPPYYPLQIDMASPALSPRRTSPRRSRSTRPSSGTRSAPPASLRLAQASSLSAIAMEPGC